jgi:peptidoglycan-associated lipoprotein
MWKGFLTGLIVVVILVAPACRSSKGKKDVKTDTSTTATAFDTISIPTTTTQEPVVEQRDDFVKTDTPRDETPTLPRDIEQLNRYVQDQGLVRDAFFGYDGSTLDDAAQAALTASATWLRAHPNYNLLVEGHCDERGTEQYNLALGDRRANIVKEYLMTLGIDGSRIRTVSYGEERPFDEGHDESAYAKNRRGHLVLVTR